MGFHIRDSNGCEYPLYLLIEPPLTQQSNQVTKSQQVSQDALNAIYLEKKTKHLIQFE